MAGSFKVGVTLNPRVNYQIYKSQNCLSIRAKEVEFEEINIMQTGTQTGTEPSRNVWQQLEGLVEFNCQSFLHK